MAELVIRRANPQWETISNDLFQESVPQFQVL